MRLWLKILLAVLLINLLGGIGAVFTVNAIPEWYARLNRPPGVPPNWVFGPVWTLLYTSMGVAFALVWDRGEPGAARKRALIWFAVQMILNILWTPVFFGVHRLFAALVVIVLLIGAIAITMRYFAKAFRLAAWLLVPYLMWVSYATYLNAGFWWLNRG